jgi:hypothetical protein
MAQHFFKNHFNIILSLAHGYPVWLVFHLSFAKLVTTTQQCTDLLLWVKQEGRTLTKKSEQHSREIQAGMDSCCTDVFIESTVHATTFLLF